MGQRLFLVKVFLLMVFYCSAQKEFTIIDADTNEPLLGATVIQGNAIYSSNLKGEVALDENLPITIEYIGYKSITYDDLSSIEEVVSMYKTNQLLKTAVVTGSKYERSVERSTVSIDVIKPQYVESINAISVDEIMERMPGVQMVDGQVNIRGGAGFSYGAGSRVMLLINGLPALQPDAGFVNWSDIPVENIAQVEILKGASSTLYGSSAMNGIVNVLTGYPTAEPKTEAVVSYIAYDAPSRESFQWWEDTPTAVSASILHKRKIKKLDLSTSAFYYSIDSYNQFTYQDRLRYTLETRYRYSDRLNFGLNLNVNWNEGSNFFLWGARGGHWGSESTAAAGKRFRYTVDPFLTFVDNHGGQHKVNSRFYHIDNDNNLDQSNSSNNYFVEYQYLKSLDALNLDITAGTVYSLLVTNSALFNDQEFRARNYALYVQAEQKPIEDLTFTAGIRYEYNSLNTPEFFLGDTIQDIGRRDGALISRVGANYKLTEGTFLRASWGQGYRFPTITERYISTTFESFNIFPNVNLKPEQGWTAEIGIKQGMQLGSFQAFLDVSRFWQQYDDMIEFVFTQNMAGIGFQGQNIGNTSINGYEFNLGGQSEVLGTTIRFFGGYTYIEPKYRDFDDNELLQNSLSSEGPENILKYRTRHNVKFDAEIDIKGIKLGANIEQTSHMVNVDAQLEGFNGIGQYRDANDEGFRLLSFRLGYEWNDLSLTLNLKNALNIEYTQRPGLLEETRNLGVRLAYSL